MLRVNYRFMGSRVEVLITKAVLARVFSRFIMVLINGFITFMIKGG